MHADAVVASFAALAIAVGVDAALEVARHCTAAAAAAGASAEVFDATFDKASLVVVVAADLSMVPLSLIGATAVLAPASTKVLGARSSDGVAGAAAAAVEVQSGSDCDYIASKATVVAARDD